jgi:glutamine---fructose-6-phosphate transaminase (isomerizing)
MNLLYQDILAQPKNLANVVAHLYGEERNRLEAAARFLDNDRPIVFTGVASAAYLCHPAEAYLNARGRFASVVYAADALYTHLPALQHANVVINTRSGETAEIVRLAQALVERHIPFVAITNEPESTAARLAKHIVWANTRKDDLVSINVVTGMMTATLALAAAAIGESDDMRAALEPLPPLMEDVVAESFHRGEEILEMFAGIRPIHLLYRGALKGAAYNGRLVLEEVARTPAVPVEAAEFRQGPNEVVDERFGALVFISGGKPGALTRLLVEDIRRCGGRVLKIGATDPSPALPIGKAPMEREESLVAGTTQMEREFALPNIPDELLSILAVVPVQVLAYNLAEAQGYQPGSTRYITKVILAEQGIPNAG